MKMKNHILLTISLSLLSVIGIILLSIYFIAGRHRPPEVILKDFYSADCPEICLMDPLILAGDKVVPLVLRDIVDKAKHRRIYGIGFLGNGKYQCAVPTLTNIIENKSEDKYVRMAAFEALYSIDVSEAKRLAGQYDSVADILINTAKAIKEDNVNISYRSFWSALFGMKN